MCQVRFHLPLKTQSSCGAVGLPTYGAGLVFASCRDRFLPFLEHTVDMHDFCQREVEPMGKECEQVCDRCTVVAPL